MLAHRWININAKKRQPKISLNLFFISGFPRCYDWCRTILEYGTRSSYLNVTNVRSSIWPPHYLDIAVESIGAFLDLQNHKRNIIILWPAAGPFLAGCDVTFDDLFWRKMRGFGQYDLRLCIPEHLAAVIESFGKTVAHQDDH